MHIKLGLNDPCVRANKLYVKLFSVSLTFSELYFLPQGYWDQVTIEITQIDLKFTELAVLEGNNWVNPEPEKKKPLKKAVAKPPRPPIGSKKAPQGSSRFKAFLAQKQAAAAVGRGEGATSASELATSATPKNLSPRVAVEERGKLNTNVNTQWLYWRDRW